MSRLEEVKKEFGLTSNSEAMRAMIKVAMASQILNDLEHTNKIAEESREILRLAALRLLENKEMTGLQRSHREMNYWDAQPKKTKK